MTKSTTIVALTCVLIAGAAAVSFLADDDATASTSTESTSATTVAALTSSGTTKTDKLVRTVAAYSPPPPMVVKTEPVVSPLRQAFASADVPSAFPDPAPKVAAPVAIPAVKPPADTAKVALKPPTQKSYSLLSDGQIAGIRERMKFTPDQEAYWPAIESSLKAIARRLHATRPGAAAAPQIDPNWIEVQQLKSAAMPLLWQLREDQKREVRSLANLIGLTAVASMI